MTDEKMIFTAAVSPGETGTSALLLAESIRVRAGRLSTSPIRIYVSPGSEALPKEIRERLTALGVELIPYGVDVEAAKFFFVPEATAAAQAERDAEGEAEIMVWLGANTLVIQEPKAFRLPAERSLGYRPVHITNIGSPMDIPLDDFWSQIYGSCGVKPERVFPMRTHVDGNTVRPYFNAGHLAVRPEKRVIRAWVDAFLRLYRAPEFQSFFADGRYRIFMHQAVLSAVILARCTRDEIVELPPTYNYPIHLYDVDRTGGRPASIEELVTARHEGFYEEPDWYEKMPAGDPLKRWLRDRLP